MKDMHYGDGMMNEEIERARKRAEAASSRKSGFSYQSPLGNGFSFDSGKSMDEQRNPYSRRRNQQQGNNVRGADDGFRIEYEEAHFDMGNSAGDFSQARRVMKAKEQVVERMKDRRKTRVRERGEPLSNDAESSGCVIM